MDQSIILIDAGTGNLRSVHKALESLGAQVTLTADPQAIVNGHKLVLPGVGAFGDFMGGLRLRRIEAPLLEAARRGVPLLGICVGMQALFETGEELGEHQGLGLLPGRVIRFPGPIGLKVPHTGWNQLMTRAGSPLWKDVRAGDYVYFNHAYYCAPSNSADTAATTEYGLQFTSAVQRNRIFGVQFHPEKSQNVGLQILANFLAFPVSDQ